MRIFLYQKYTPKLMANVKKNLGKQRFELYRGEGVASRRDEGIKYPPCGGQYTGH